MIGLVIWSDNTENKAVFWCEDHGDLAYFDAGLEAGARVGALHPGDMVRFDITLDGNIRRAQHPHFVSRGACESIQDHLRSAAKVETLAAEREALGANVVSFSRTPGQGGRHSARRTG